MWIGDNWKHSFQPHREKTRDMFTAYLGYYWHFYVHTKMNYLKWMQKAHCPFCTLLPIVLFETTCFYTSGDSGCSGCQLYFHFSTTFTTSSWFMGKQPLGCPQVIWCILHTTETMLMLTQHKKASNHHANHTPGNVQFYIVTTWETPGNHWCWWPDTLIIARALARVIIKVLGHQHQWFPGVSQVVTM